VLNRFLVALSFLTIFPIKLKNINEKDILNSVIVFPLIGFLDGIITLFLVLILKQIFSPMVISLLLILTIYALRGIFHIDGLSDTFDALFYKGSGEKDRDIHKRLEIMKDSTVGVAGVLALIINILCKFVFIKEIIELNKFAIFLLVFTFSRWAMVPLMYYGKPAKNIGLGAIFIGKINLQQFIISAILPVFLLIYFTFKNFPFLPLIVLFLLILLFMLKRVFEEKFGGLTGDHLGATVEITEVAFLFCFLFFEKLWLNF
jgi:adenosylcobinamide-GDP ribazoletransferase